MRAADNFGRKKGKNILFFPISSSFFPIPFFSLPVLVTRTGNGGELWRGDFFYSFPPLFFSSFFPLSWFYSVTEDWVRIGKIRLPYFPPLFLSFYPFPLPPFFSLPSFSLFIELNALSGDTRLSARRRKDMRNHPSSSLFSFFFLPLSFFFFVTRSFFTGRYVDAPFKDL